MDGHNLTPFRQCVEVKRRRTLSQGPLLNKCSVSSNEVHEDSLTEVLVRLPAKDVHRCKCVSKRWLSLISNSSFGKYYSKFNDKHTTSFVIAHTFDDYYNDQFGKLKGILVTDCKSDSESGLVSVLGSRGRLFDLGIYDYFPALKEPDVDGLINYTVSGVSDQFLLIEASFTSPERRILYVINPITKHCAELPQLKLPSENLAGDVGFMHNHPSDGEFTVINVKRTSNSNNVKRAIFDIQIFSSSSDNWKLFTVPWPLGYCSTKSVQVTFWKGCFYWLGVNGIIGYDPVNTPHQCTFINFPLGQHDFDISQLLLSRTCQGKLRLYRMLRSSILVWDFAVNDGNKSNYSWSLIFKTEYEVPLSSLHYADGDKVYLVSLSTSRTVCLLDLKNGSFSDVLELPPLEQGGGHYLNEIAAFDIGSWPTSLPQMKNVGCRRDRTLSTLTMP